MQPEELTVFQVFILAAVQGITEFLPISSSAHLIVIPALADWPDQGLAFDVAVHVGTLMAVLVYFYHGVSRIVVDWIKGMLQRREVGESRLGWFIILGTIPVGVCGLLVSQYAGDSLRSPLVIALANALFAVALWWADSYGGRTRTESTLTWKDVLLIGCAQALALIPGASRSGVTITAAMGLGLTRVSAARFSFLLSIPVITLAGGLSAVDAVVSHGSVNWLHLSLGALISGGCAFFCIHFFLRWVQYASVLPFVIYRLALAALLLGLVVAGKL